MNEYSLDFHPVVIKYVENNERQYPIFAEFDGIDYYADIYSERLGTKLDAVVAFDVVDKRIEDEDEKQFIKGLIASLYRCWLRASENYTNYKYADGAFRHEYLDRIKEENKNVG